VPGRAGTGRDRCTLRRLYEKLTALAIKKMPLNEAPPRGGRFGSPLKLSEVTWVKPTLVAQVRYLTWTADGLMRQIVYLGLRKDKPAKQVVRARPV
jgi:bifunctional non-homologous end joining protein LigD